MTKITEIINNRANNILNYPIENGHNGPYYHQETEVRILSHRIVEVAIYILKFNKEHYKEHLIELANLLISKKNKPHNITYLIRPNHDHDQVNGVLGQAWVIEALVYAYKVTSLTKYIKEAIRLFKVHPFDQESGLWKSVEVDGTIVGIDDTYNHQLWFFTSGLLILEMIDDKTAQLHCQTFMSKLGKNFIASSRGLIKNYLPLKGIPRLKRSIKKTLIYLQHLPSNKTRKYKENGYQLFNLYALAVIYIRYPNDSFFKSKKFNKALKYAFTDNHFNWNLNTPIDYDLHQRKKVVYDKYNIYGFPYNPLGFEMTFVSKVFKKFEINKTMVEKFIAIQISNHFDSKTQRFTKNTDDPETLDARFYELLHTFEIEEGTL